MTDWAVQLTVLRLWNGSSRSSRGYSDVPCLGQSRESASLKRPSRSLLHQFTLPVGVGGWPRTMIGCIPGVRPRTLLLLFREYGRIQVTAVLLHVFDFVDPQVGATTGSS